MIKHRPACFLPLQPSTSFRDLNANGGRSGPSWIDSAFSDLLSRIRYTVLVGTPRASVLQMYVKTPQPFKAWAGQVHAGKDASPVTRHCSSLFATHRHLFPTRSPLIPTRLSSRIQRHSLTHANVRPTSYRSPQEASRPADEAYIGPSFSSKVFVPTCGSLNETCVVLP